MPTSPTHVLAGLFPFPLRKCGLVGGSRHSGRQADPNRFPMCALEGRGLHSKPDAPEHEPRGLLCDAQVTPEFVGADPVPAVGEHPEGGEPLAETERRVLEDRPHLRAELSATDAALEDHASLQEYRLVGVAVGAADAIGPAHLDHELEGDGRLGEVLDGFAQRLRGGMWCQHTS